jgi:phage RecT family recombinase
MTVIGKFSWKGIDMAVQQVAPQGRNKTTAAMVHLMEEAKPRFSLVATRYLGEDKLCALALSMWNKDSKLRQCSPQSFLLALYKACQLGLDPTGIGNQGHIIAYRGEAQFVRGWGGVITMAARRGINVDTFAVYDSDEFEVARYANESGYFLGLHHVERRDSLDEIGEVRAAYAVATCKDWEQPMIEVVWRHDIEKIRTNSASPNSPAWKGWYSEMARKTAVNRLAKRLPLFVEVKDESGKKMSMSVSAIPNEDTYYEGRVGNDVIDAPIDGAQVSELPDEEQSSPGTAQMEAISEALQLREEFPSVYPQLFGRKDITKMGRDELIGLIRKVREIGSAAETHSAAELVRHEHMEEELGF